MVAAAPKRGHQMTLDEIELVPDPEAWLAARGGLCVPQEAVDAEGPAFRAEIERERTATGRVFEDKDGWHLLNSWIVENEKGVWAVAHKIVRAHLAPDVDDVFAELCAMCLSWAKWVRPFVLRKGERKSAKFLTVVQTFGVRKYMKAKPYRMDPGQFCEDYQEEAVPAGEFRTAFEAVEHIEHVLGHMEPFERHAVSEVFLHGTPLRELAKAMGRRVRDVEALVLSGVARARAALLPEGGGA